MMVAIPIRKTTALLIDAVDVTENDPRGYLGMSSIGETCERKLWFGFHFVKPIRKIKQRINRIFNTGHIAEQFIIADLKRIGYQVYRYGNDDQKIEMTGHKDEQQDECVDITGHFKGHTDGNVLGVIEAPNTEHLLEMKTHNDKYFKQLVKQCVKKGFPKHYAQMQIYMYYRKLKRALYVGYNKNDCSYYFERVEFDKEYANELRQKSFRIIIQEHIPKNIFHKNWFECKWCDYYDNCYKDEKADKNCRTCVSCDAIDLGQWACSMNNDKVLTKDEQLKGCSYHKYGWGL